MEKSGKAVSSVVLFSVCLQPIEVIRTLSIHRKIKDSSLLSLYCMSREIFQTQGISPFFRGSTLQIAKTGLNFVVFFSTLETLQHLSASSSILSNMKDAALAKAVSTLVAYPLTTLKTRVEA